LEAHIQRSGSSAGEQQQRKSKGKRYRDMRRSRTIIQAEQLDILYGCYFKDPNPGKHEFEQISEWVHLPKKVVQIWFQNMRARERKGEVRFISDGTLREPVKDLGKPAVVKKIAPVPIKPKEVVSSTNVSPVSSSTTAVPKTKLETTSNVTMVKVAPKVNTPVLLAPPKDPIPIAPRPAQKRNVDGSPPLEKQHNSASFSVCKLKLQNYTATMKHYHKQNISL
uniref:Homeobox domain-containing protein n=1 Tax=Sander lucioperca TaxID=283035 RepID=A0A8D0A2D9_SANLU